MIAKFGFILLVILFGALMFIAGTMAPPSLHSYVAAGIARIVPRSAAMTAGTTTGADTITASGAAGVPAKGDDKNKPVPYQSLLLRSPLPAKAQYALQAGMFSDAAAANGLNARLTKLGYPSQIIAVVDTDQQTWQVVAAGSFGSLNDADAARIRLAQALNLAQPPSTIVLPPPPKPAK